MGKKILFFIIIICIAAITVPGYFWLVAQKPAPNSQVQPAVEYVNNQYGFKVALPQSWKGYSVVTAAWSGDTISQSGQVTTNAVQGPMVSLRNPLWTMAKPYQDIPVMVFTVQQWNDMQEGKFHIGAAPINPSELGSNSEYVFGLPARYNFAYPAGWQEVDQIIQSKALQAFSSGSIGTNGSNNMPGNNGNAVLKVGDSEFNFRIQKVNANSVSGLWYMWYPVASNQGQIKTLNIGDSVGYACEGKTAILVAVDVANQTATFKETITKPPAGGCPI